MRIRFLQRKHHSIPVLFLSRASSTSEGRFLSCQVKYFKSLISLLSLPDQTRTPDPRLRGLNHCQGHKLLPKNTISNIVLLLIFQEEVLHEMVHSEFSCPPLKIVAKGHFERVAVATGQ